MKRNISRYTQLDNTILLEYIINNEYQNYDSDSFDVDMYSLKNNKAQLLFCKKTSNIDSGLLYIDNNDRDTNNGFKHLSLPISSDGDKWFIPKDNNLNTIEKYLQLKNYNNSFCKKTELYQSNTNIAYDIIRLHILSGYTFNDIYGILLHVSTLNDDGNNINLANWFYKNNDREYFYEKPIIINNRIYDKYIEFKIPSIQYISSIEYRETSNDDIMLFKKDLSIKENNLTNINVSYSTISKDNVEIIYNEELNNKEEIGVNVILDGKLYLQIPYNSQTDNFNLHLSEASDGDYFNFYTTWCDYPLNSNIVSLFNTKIKLYESKVINETYDSIYEEPNIESNWVVIHELTTSFYGENGNKVLMDEKYSITQEFNESEIEKNVFKYKPIISDSLNCNLVKNILINYTAKLINRLDGNQIVRHGSLSTSNVKKYCVSLSRLETKNINQYAVYNKIINTQTTLKNTNSLIKNKYVKVFYNINDVYLEDNEQNSPIEFLRNTSTYKFRFKKRKEDGTTEYMDLTDLNSYVFVYKDKEGIENRINCTYSSNMNLFNGELEFNLTKTHIDKMMNSPYDYFDIVVVNADGFNSTLYESKYKFK